ncbi:MAG: alpha/beta hydrolase family protein [Corynebacterium sp.]|nr:alpha/beta hydrolase family protein [Corynebacterium sp.]
MTVRTTLLTRLRLLTATGIACASIAVAPLPAAAQSSDAAVSAIYDSAADALYWPSANMNTTRDVENFYAFMQANTHWNGVPIWNMWGTEEGTPYTPDTLRDYPAPRLVKTEPDERFPVDRLYIESPAMRRVVQVQVLHPADRTTPAPMLYLLDGVTAPIQHGWLRKGDVLGALKNEHVTAIMPVEAGGSNYTDWTTTDPHLGYYKWETFLTQELPQVLETQANIPFNGERYIGGLSMGGSGAVRLAALHPDLYAGTFGISGCYSTTSTMGHEFLNLITRVVGGTPSLQWTDEERARNDIANRPDIIAGMKDMNIYLYAGNGVINAATRDTYREDGLEGPVNLFGAMVLEKTVNSCTRDFSAALDAQGVAHTLNLGDGIHEWPLYKAQLPVAWAAVSEGKYTR